MKKNEIKKVMKVKSKAYEGSYSNVTKRLQKDYKNITNSIDN